MKQTFFANFEKALRASANKTLNGRLQGSTLVALTDLAAPAKTDSAEARYELFGPGDVQRLAVGAITRRFPAPQASDAEVTKLALVEFSAVDLPWRYTPQLASGGALRPWLVLVVGQRAPDDIVLRPDGRVTLGLVAQQNHPLATSALLAHVHQVEGHAPIARLLAPPRKGGYLAETEYVACLVPAFAADGTDVWNGAATVTCDLYDCWTFRTGLLGDFPELAEKLHRADLAANQKPGGKPFGIAEVIYRRRAASHEVSTLATAGALRLPDLDDEPAPIADLSPDIAQETGLLTLRVVTPDGRGVVTAPRYDAPFSDANAAAEPTPGGWIDQLRTDPRLRGAAGLGTYTAIEWQDRIADAAAAKAGDLSIASDRIRHVALGVEASRSLWRRRVPPTPAAGGDPAAAAELLAVLGPALSRLVTTDGSSVLDSIAGRTPQLTRALLSSAARRALRPGPARSALSAVEGAPFGALLVAANDCGGAGPDPAAIPRGGGSPARATKEAVLAACGGDHELSGKILDVLGAAPSAGKLAATLRALAPTESGKPDPSAVERLLRTDQFPEPDPSIAEWPLWMKEHERAEPCRPLDLAGLAAVVSRAIDPTVERPPAVERVLATLPGITHIGPVEIEPELDLPLWSFLSARAPDWMLPGSGDLVDGDVVALSTNPVFVESLLVGANHQATAELRWRNVPLVTRWSPLRKFWQRAASELDILPIKDWPETAALGSADVVPPQREAEAVVAFCTPLFRRYPATVVYLHPAAADWQTPPEADKLKERNPPTFTGGIGSNITFFGFKVEPKALGSHWVVLEEPPAGFRFFHEPKVPPKDAPNSSSELAYHHFAQPVRVLIGQLLIKKAAPP